jgi:hypothetical protein
LAELRGGLLTNTLEPGDPVATFDEYGEYDNNHTGIFVKYVYDDTGAISGFYMIDQNNYGTYKQPSSLRFYDKAEGLGTYYKAEPPGA